MSTEDNNSKTKMVAAISAVMSYIRQDEEMALQAMSAPERLGAAFSRSMNLWGTNGRQTIMQTRTMMQMKAFYR